MSVSVSWQPPPVAEQNGIIRIYNISVTEEETGNVIELCTEKTSTVITNLHPDYNYSISVAAFTVQTGPFSSSISLKTHEDGITILLLYQQPFFLSFTLSLPDIIKCLLVCDVSCIQLANSCNNLNPYKQVSCSSTLFHCIAPSGSPEVESESLHSR